MTQMKNWREIEINENSIPKPRNGVGSVLYKQFIYIFGGYDGTDRLNDLYSFDTIGCIWRELTFKQIGNIPSKREGHTCNRLENRMYIIGGYDGDYCSDIYELNLNNLIWNKIKTKGNFEGRYYSSSVLYNNTIYLFGGKRNKNFFKGIKILNLENKEWNNLKTIGIEPSPRYFSQTILRNDQLYVFGGFNGNALNDFHCLNLNSFQWREIKILNYLSPEKRSGHQCCILNDKLYLFGGLTSISSTNSFFSFNFQNEKWDRITSKIAPPKRYNHITISNELISSIFILFGYDTGKRYNDIFIYSFEKLPFERLKYFVNDYNFMDIEFIF
eukprot:gene5065-8665_t